MLKKYIKSNCVVPVASHMKRLIRAVQKKIILYRFENQPLRDGMIITIFAQVEYIVNSRPRIVNNSGVVKKSAKNI